MTGGAILKRILPIYSVPKSSAVSLPLTGSVFKCFLFFSVYAALRKLKKLHFNARQDALLRTPVNYL